VIRKLPAVTKPSALIRKNVQNIQAVGFGGDVGRGLGAVEAAHGANEKWRTKDELGGLEAVSWPQLGVLDGLYLEGSTAKEPQPYQPVRCPTEKQPGTLLKGGCLDCLRREKRGNNGSRFFQSLPE